MIQAFVDRFMAAKPALREQFKTSFPSSYKDIVTAVMKAIGDEDGYDEPDVNRLVEIDHGDYQGTLLYVVGAGGYQPSTYWATFVGYGSCSGCDTLQDLRDDGDWDADYKTSTPTDRALDGVMTLALHIVQRMRKISGYDMEGP